VVQGAGAAIMTPTALSIISTTFTEGAERNKALGIWAPSAFSHRAPPGTGRDRREGHRLAGRTHTHRLSALAELANMAVFMASGQASGMTGTTVNLSMGSLDD
jgi:hypothetical protein